MNTKTLLLSMVAISCMALTSCSNDEEGPNPVETRISLTSEQAGISDRLQTFSWQLLDQLYQQAPIKNALCSPLSIETNLGMVLNGMTGEGKQELLSLLGLEGMSDETINLFFQTMAIGIDQETDNRTRFTSTNSVWYRKSLSLNADFQSALTQYYKAEFYPVNFTSGTADNINKWCSQKTNGRIPSIVEGTSEADQLYLINAVYFLSKWADKFTETRSRPFTNATGNTETVNMMRRTYEDWGSYRYAYDDTYQAAALNFSSKTYSMVFILPDADRTISEVLENITTKGLNLYSPENKLVISVPKFETSSDYQLADVLRSMGCTLFDRPESFNIFTTNNIAPNQMRHKAYLKIDEEGAEAAAVTSTGIATSAGPLPGEPIYLFFNRPFLYAIIENSTGYPLFLGYLGHVNDTK